MNAQIRTTRSMAALGLLGLAAAAQASCGSASCSLLNDPFALGTWDHVGWSADFRLEYVAQNRLRRGTDTIAATDVSGEEAIERRTRNTNLVTTLERSFNPSWSMALRVPMVRRDHLHDLVDQATGDIGPSEQWRFTRLGDVQLLGRWQDTDLAPDSSWAVTAGLKLPTGSKDVTNADGTRAERALQPGTGTTDLVVGIASRRVLGGADALNLQASWIEALNRSEQFKPGRRIEVAAGWAHACSPSLSAIVQLNLSHKARDRGDQAEPDNSGSTSWSVSPGLSVAVGAHSIVYGFVQLPVYQKVNGIQLVPRTGFAAGYTTSF